MDADLQRYLEGMEKRLEVRSDERTRDLETRLRAYIDEQTTTLREYTDERSHDLENRLREYIDERSHDVETRIVRAFGAYQESGAVRMRKIEADVSNINASTTQQLDAVQSKLLDLETRIINLEGPQGSTARN
jgi:DNA repair exonuclease SbcCD ATPase subunit